MYHTMISPATQDSILKVVIAIVTSVVLHRFPNLQAEKPTDWKTRRSRANMFRII